MKKLLFSLLLAGGVQNSLAMHGGGAAQGGTERCTAFLKQLKQKYSEPPIITAIKENNLALVEQLIAMGENVNSCDKSARTALMFAAQSGNCQIAKALVDAGADVNASGIGLLTPLMYAALNGHVDVVDMLIASGKLNINAQDQRNQTALMLAQDHGHEVVAARLFQAGARIEKVFVQFADGSIHSLELARLRALNSSVLNSFLDNDSIECDTTENSPIILDIFANLQDFSEFEVSVKCPLGGNEDKLIDFLKKAHFFGINIVNMLKDLKYSSHYNKYEICKCLLSQNSDFVTDLQNAFPEILIHAIWKDDLVFAKSLIRAGIDVNTMDNRGYSAMVAAIEKENIEIVKLLITARADVNAKILDQQYGEMSLLNWAVRYEHQDIVLSCIQAGAYLNNIDDYDCLNNDGLITLYYAACEGHTEIAKLLIALGTDVNAIWEYEDEESQDNETVLMVAARHGHTEIVKLLIDSRASIDIPDNDGKTALIIAGSKGHTETAKLLIAKGADVNAGANDGYTALIEAASKEHTEIVKLLISASADINITANDGCTALMAAAINGHTEIVKLLIDAGADLNISAADGCTALIKAVQNRQTEIVKLLIDAGAGVDIRASDGCTALNYAARNGHKEIAKLLIDANAYFDGQEDNMLVKLLTQ
jgi:ankyrin repeat protein